MEDVSAAGHGDRGDIPTVTFKATGGIPMAALPARRSGRTLTVVKPSPEFEDIYGGMRQLMTLAFGLSPAALADMPWVPTADLSETDDAYVAQVDLPAVNKDQVEVQIQDRELIVSGEVTEPEDS